MNLAIGKGPVAHSPMYHPHMNLEIKKQMRELMMDKNNVNMSISMDVKDTALLAESTT